MSRQSEDAAAKEFLHNVIDTLRERAITYPPYSDEALKVMMIWNALYPANMIEAKQVPLFMRIVKMVRQTSGNSPDSLIDEAGYIARQAGMQ